MTPRAIAGGIALVAFIAFAVYFDHVRDKASRYDEARAALISERQLFADYKAGMEADRVARDAAEEKYVGEIALLRADIGARPVPVVRVCQSPAAASVPAGESVAASAGSAAPAAGLLPAGTAADTARGRDIGPAIFGLADRADELSAQLRAAQSYWGQ